MRAFAGFRAVLCLSIALMMAISWPLWVTGGSFPKVPWFGWVRLLPEWASWVRFAILQFGLIVASLPRSWPLRRSRPPLELSGGVANPGWNHRTVALTVALALTGWMVLEDQFRLQPWMYQFLLMGFCIATCRTQRAMLLCRVLVIAIYLHSGLSKLDRSFQTEIGPLFADHLRKAIGLDIWHWSLEARKIVAVLMPCWEIAVASALATRMWRVGVAGAILLHVSLLLILGPWGLDHSAIVLIWNAALMVEVAFLFAPHGRTIAPPGEPGSPARRTEWIASALVLIACLMPLTTRVGWWDAWASFALYASSNETTGIAVSTAGAEVLSKNPNLVPWHDYYDEKGRVVAMVVDIKDWSLRERRVPLYPSNRVMNGVAEAVAARSQLGTKIRAWHHGRAEPRTGLRDHWELEGLDAIRRFGDTFWLNAHPTR